MRTGRLQSGLTGGGGRAYAGGMRTLLVVAIVALLLNRTESRAQAPSCTFGPGALPADTLPPGGLHGDDIPIEHIVVIMQENRSYDHYFGRLRRKSGPPRGSSNPNPTGGDPIKPFHTHLYCEVDDLDHSWSGTHREVNGGAMDGFTTENVTVSDPKGQRAMGYYTRRDIPYYYKLYKKFAMGDRFFCSVLSQTFPNRYYLLAGTSFGEIRNNIPDLGGPEYTARTIFNLMDEASPPVSWKIYYSDLPFGAIFGYVRQQRLGNTYVMGTNDATNPLLIDAANGTLPQVAYVDPAFTGEAENDEHPPTNMQKGQAFTAKIINAIMNGPNWENTVIFLTYDEHGGYYDHVPPPPACLPDATPPDLLPSDVPGAFDNYGVRIPMVAISPYSRRAFVSHTVYDHTSILRFIENRFDLPALTNRDANADPMLELFDFSKKTFATPPKLPAAVISPDHPECP
jgi:phospholipase C